MTIPSKPSYKKYYNKKRMVEPAFKANYHHIVNATSGQNYMSSGYIHTATEFDPEKNMHKEDEKILAQFELIQEIVVKVEKLKIYATKNKLELQEVLESFLTEDEVEIYENRREIERKALIIKKALAEQVAEIDKKLKEYEQPKVPDNIFDDFNKRINDIDKNKVNVPGDKINLDWTTYRQSTNQLHLIG